MNADKMTREEFDVWVGVFESKHTPDERKEEAKNKLWARFNAAQSDTFMPDWSLKPEYATGFIGEWTGVGGISGLAPGEFYLPAPSNDEKVQMVGEGVSRNDQPFRPDWSLKPPSARSFRGNWSSLEAKDCTLTPGEFVLAAPNNPSDAELSAMWEKLDLATKKRALEAVKE